MDPAWAKIFSDWMQFALAGAIGGLASVWAVLAGRDARLERRTGEIGERLSAAELRLAVVPDAEEYDALKRGLVRLEASTASGPNHEDIKRLHARVDTVAEGLAGVRGEMAAQTRLLTTIDQHLRGDRR